MREDSALHRKNAVLTVRPWRLVGVSRVHARRSHRRRSPRLLLGCRALVRACERIIGPDLESEASEPTQPNLREPDGAGAPLVMFAPDSARASLQKRLVAVAIADELGVTLATQLVG
jgi:hypothetical protein